MRRIFLFLLKKYSKTEKDRLVIFKSLQDSVEEDYTEQTKFGNLYNANIEFLMSSELMIELSEDTMSLEMIKSGLSKSFTESVHYINNEIKKR